MVIQEKSVARKGVYGPYRVSYFQDIGRRERQEDALVVGRKSDLGVGLFEEGNA